VSADPAVEVRLDLRYGRASEIDLHLDIYRPVAHRGPLPVVLYLHGGGWRVGSRADREADRQLPLARLGFALASADYRLSGVAGFPAQLEDAASALAFIARHAAEFGWDSTRIALAGASAGAHLAALLALAPASLIGEAALPPLRAVISWFPVTDVAGYDAEWRNAPTPPAGSFAAQGAAKRGWPPPERVAALFSVAHAEEADPAAVASADPRHHIVAAAARGSVPPFLILHGDADSAVGLHHGRQLHEALIAAGLASTLLILASADHEDAAFGAPAPLGAVAGLLHRVFSG
jgi:acetyl esterase/lipase